MDDDLTMPTDDGIYADAYNQAWHGTHEPTTMTIWCDHCHRSHYATPKSNDICALLAGEIREAQRQATISNAVLSPGKDVEIAGVS